MSSMRTIDGPVEIGVNPAFIQGYPDAKPLYYHTPGAGGQKIFVEEINVLVASRFAARPAADGKCGSVRLVAETIQVRE